MFGSQIQRQWTDLQNEEFGTRLKTVITVALHDNEIAASEMKAFY